MWQRPLKAHSIDRSSPLKDQCLLWQTNTSANTRRWLNVRLMLAHRLRRWTNINSTLGQHIVFPETFVTHRYTQIHVCTQGQPLH